MLISLQQYMLHELCLRQLLLHTKALQGYKPHILLKGIKRRRALTSADIFARIFTVFTWGFTQFLKSSWACAHSFLTSTTRVYLDFPLKLCANHAHKHNGGCLATAHVILQQFFDAVQYSTDVIWWKQDFIINSLNLSTALWVKRETKKLQMYEFSIILELNKEFRTIWLVEGFLAWRYIHRPKQNKTPGSPQARVTFSPQINV